MDDPDRLYTHHAACGCTFDQEDAPVRHCPEAESLAARRREAMRSGSPAAVRTADGAYHGHLARALAGAKA